MERQAKDGTLYQQVGQDEWTPITRTAKDGTVYSKVGADEWRPLEKPKNNPLMSGVRKLSQGVSAGYSDEISGAVEGAGRALGLSGAGGPIKDISISKDGPTLDWEIIKDAYKRARDKEREALKKDSKDNPGVSLALELTGAALSPVNRILPGSSLAKSGAAIGAVNATGMSEADSSAGLAKDALVGAAGGALLGKGAEKLQGAVSSGIQKLADKIQPAKAKMNADEIRAAAKELGIKVTPGMLDDTGFIERLESALAKSPSFFGRSLAKNRDAVINRMSEAGQDLTSEATGFTPFQLGEKFKSGVTAKVGERLDPISTVFNEVAESTRNIPIKEKSLSAIKRNIENLDVYQLTGGAGKPSQYAEMIPRLKNADQVKTAMTLLNKDIASSQGAEKQVLIAIKEKLGTLEKNSIMRSAIETAKEGGMREATGKSIGSGVVNDLRDARRGYYDLSKDLKSVAENARLKTKNGPSAFLNELENIPSERISDKFFNVENNRQLSNLKEKFPEEFNLLRQGKIKDVLERSTDNSLNGQGKFASNKFLNEIRNLNDEAKAMLFPGKLDVIKNLETIQKSLPRNFNPSGTASEMGWQDAIYRNVKDIPTYALYRGASSNLAKDIAKNLKNTPEFLNLYKKKPEAFQNLVSKLEQQAGFLSSSESAQLLNVADESPKKGPDKWAIDGLEKLKKHDSKGVISDTKVIDELLKSKKGKDLLIQASDLKPGTPAMDKILMKIKTSYLNGEE